MNTVNDMHKNLGATCITEERLHKNAVKMIEQAVQEIMTDIKDTIGYAAMQAYLKGKEDAKNELDVDGEIARLQNELDEERNKHRYRKFEMSEESYNKAQEFMKKHDEMHKQMGPTMKIDLFNSHYEYIITPCIGGLGTGWKIRCKKCGEELNITDYGEW